NYKIVTLMKSFKNPAIFSDDDTDKSFDFLANINPALKSKIADVVISVLQTVNLTTKSVDVTSQILPAIDAYLDLSNASKRDTKGLLIPAALDSIIAIKMSKAH
ncbi:MAG: hypothetical protein NT128_00835, partial [Proteobacteria bacterium]|nr:hypothetical protein [Pseudomonadota bacterium]